MSRHPLHLSPSSIAGKVAVIYALLMGLNVAAWALALLAFRHYPVLLGMALVAYSFGLRHAVDADHIAAIDNVTRKLMQEGKRPAAVGLMFSLGHSTVVIVGSAAIAAGAMTLQQHSAALRQVAALTGTLVSTLFLLAIGAVNLLVLRSLYASFARVRRGERYGEEDFDLLLGSRGFLARLFRPVFGMVRHDWHMYPVGFLFGLGFDTATEIGVVGIAALEAAKGLSLWSVLIFPALFAAGMSLIDTTDNILMLGAYGWAFVKPVRKIYYNLTITFVSAAVALVIGGIEGLGLLAAQLNLRGALWEAIGRLNSNFATLGFFIIGLFAASWIVSVAIYRWRRFDELEAKLEVEA